MHPAHRVLAVLVLLELDAVALQALHHSESARRCLIHSALIDDSIIGAGDLRDVIFWLGLTGNDGVVDTIHTHRQGTGVPHMRLLQKKHLCPIFGSRQCRHGAGSTTADHQHVTVQPDGAV